MGERSLPDRAWRVLLPVALVGLVAEAVIVAGTFLASEPPAPPWLVAVLVAGVVPVHLCLLFTLRRRQQQRGGPSTGVSFVGSAPWSARLVGATFFLFWLAGLSAFFGGAGNTEEHDGRYYSNDHGELTQITRSEYDERRRLTQRSWTAIPGGFYAFGVAAGLTLRGRPDDRARVPVP